MEPQIMEVKHITQVAANCFGGTPYGIRKFFDAMAYHISATSAALLLGTGSYAYLKTGSIPSIIGSTAIAFVFGASSYLNHATDHQVAGHSLGVLAGCACLAIGLKRYPAASKKFGPISLISIGFINIPYHVYKLQQWL